MRYISTRSKTTSCKASEAIVKGLSDEGGLFVPEEFPTISLADLEMLVDKSYEERSAYVISKFLTDFSYMELLNYATRAYSRFDGDDPCPLVAIDDTTYILELWHGPTSAFKDMALTLLPYLMAAARNKTGETNKTLVLVATSGDTGKAALEGFKDVEGCEIMVFYPSEGVSDMQKLQMITQEGSNVYVCGIEGNFDDAQSAVKTIFNDAETVKLLAEKGYRLSSANSINWGRLVPQIAYYVSAYVDILASGKIKVGDKINFCVPTGNFGNILAGYYAMKMGVPISKLICASNINNVLTDFFEQGKYNINRDFYKTISPSMDILISSNLERLLFEISGKDDKFIANIMHDLATKGYYEIDYNLIQNNANMFIAGACDEEETLDTIANFYDDNDYLLDTHTAVAMGVYTNFLATVADNTVTVVVSTASPYKFAGDVYDALSEDVIEDSLLACKKLNAYTGIDIPEPLQGLDEKEIRFNDCVDKNDIKKVVLDRIIKQN